MKKKVFVSFLMPFAIRGVEAPFLWVFLKQLHHFKPGEIVFIASRAYIDAFDSTPQERYEFTSHAAAHYHYQIIGPKKLHAYTIIEFDTDHIDMAKRSPSALYHYLLTQNDSSMSRYCAELLQNASDEFELLGVLTWCNMPSLKSATEAFGLKLIHNELGPLRAPTYEKTAYFDFSGVNGHTESKKRFNTFLKESPLKYCLSLEEINRLIFRTEHIPKKHHSFQYDIGIALQVEDDSNILAFSNGYDTLSLINHIKSSHAGQKICIREHPDGHFRYNKLGEIDISRNALDFMSKCREIATINSSVALEAMLLQKPLRLYGDSPFAFVLDLIDDEQRLLAINFLVFGYLIPYDFLFDYDYYRWRISEPSETKIFLKHLDYYQEKYHHVTPKERAKVFRSNEVEGQFIQLFVDLGDGFTEADSTRFPLNQRQATQRFVFNFDSNNVKKIRIDPLDNACVVELLAISAQTERESITLDLAQISSNAQFKDQNYYFFETHDPHFAINEMPSAITTLNIEMKYLNTGASAIRECLLRIQKDLQTKLQERQSALHVKDQELQASRSALQERQSALHVKDQELQASRSALQESQSALHVKDQELQASHSALQESQSALHVKDQELQASHSALQESQSALHVKDQELQASRSALQESQSALHVKDQEFLSKNHEIDALQNELTLIYTGKSWQLTRPLRKIKKRLMK